MKSHTCRPHRTARKSFVVTVSLILVACTYSLMLPPASTGQSGTLGTSVVFGGGGGALATLPAQTPYTSLPATEIVFRLESTSTRPQTQVVFGAANIVIYVAANSTWMSAYVAGNNNQAGVNISGQALFKFTWNSADRVMVLESWDAQGGNHRTSGPVTSDATGPVNVSGGVGVGRWDWADSGHLAQGTQLAWLRWRNGQGTAGVAPANCETAPYNIARWEFEGNGADSSGNGFNLAYSGSPSYTNTPGGINCAPPRAIHLNGVGSGGVITLPNSAPFNALGDFEIAFRMRDARVNHASPQRVISNDHIPIFIAPSGDQLVALDWSTGGQGAAINVSTRTYFKVRRVQSAGTVTIEGWNADGSNYAIATLTGGSTGPLNFSGTLGFGRDYWAATSLLQAKIDWLRWKSSVGPAGLQPSDFRTDYDLLRWEFDGNGNDSSPRGLNLQLAPSPVFGDSPATERLRPAARAGADRTVKPNVSVTLDGSASTSSEGGPTYSWSQVSGTPVTLSNTAAVSPSFTSPTPAGDRDCLVFRLSVTDAGGTSTSDVYVGVVKTTGNDEVVISDPKVRLLVGPQLMHGSAFVPHPKFDEIEFNRGRAHGESFPNLAPHAIAGTVSATSGSRTVAGAGTHFTQEIEMDPLVSADYRGRLRIRDGGGTMREVEVESVQSDTQLTLKTAWGHANVSNVPADTYYGENSGALMTWWNYYDTAYTMYVEYYRTGNTRFLKFARKAADVWWASDMVGHGTVFEGPNSPGPRNMAMAGLILRALDGKPEYWDYINRKVRGQFDNWVFRHIDNTAWLAAPSMYYDIREDGYAQLYAVMLSHVLPDSYPLYEYGTRNPQTGTETGGLAKRQQYVADVGRTAVEFFGRLQYPDGSWRWDIDGTDLGDLKLTMQPFMVGIYLEAAILQHQITTNPAVRAELEQQIVDASRHLKDIWRTSVVPDLPGNVRWYGHWYFYHGGTTANQSLCASGCGGTTTGGNPGEVSGVRHLNAEIQHAIGYAYRLMGDPALKTHGDDMLRADFGGTDGIYGQADTPGKPKDYNMNYRGAGRYLAWRLTPPSQAIALDGADDRGLVTLPNAAPFNALGDFEIAFRMRDARVNHTAYQDVFTNDAVAVRIGANTDWLGIVVWADGGAGPYINIGTRTYFRIRHVRSTGVTTVEGWDAAGSNYAFSQTTGGTTGTINFAGDLGIGRAPWTGGHSGPLQAKIDWLRWRSTVGPTGVRPPDGDTDFDLLRWEFEGGGNDSSANGLHLTLFGSPAFGNSP